MHFVHFVERPFFKLVNIGTGRKYPIFKIFHWSVSLIGVSSKQKLKMQNLDSFIFTLFEVVKGFHPAFKDRNPDFSPLFEAERPREIKISPLCLKLKGFPIQHEKSRFPPSCFLSSPAGTPPLPGSPTPNDNEREGEQPTSLFGNYIRFLPNQHPPQPTHPFLSGYS